jgi:MoaE-MoaD fusion protein
MRGLTLEYEAEHMQISVRYFAAAREAAGVETETLDLPDGADVAAARELVAGRHAALAPLLPRCALAVNRAYATPQTPLRDGDELALLPPVGGG